MHPVCVQFPGERRLADALWRVLEAGAASRTSRNGNGSPWRIHLENLLYLVREKLSSASPGEQGLWMERRELGDLLMVLDDGLRALSGQPGEAGGPHEAVAVFLQEVRRHLPPMKKPVSRQAGRARAAAAVAGAAAGA